jgi:hypothetical protein
MNIRKLFALAAFIAIALLVFAQFGPPVLFDAAKGRAIRRQKRSSADQATPTFQWET